MNLFRPQKHDVRYLRDNIRTNGMLETILHNPALNLWRHLTQNHVFIMVNSLQYCPDSHPSRNHLTNLIFILPGMKLLHQILRRPPPINQEQSSRRVNLGINPAPQQYPGDNRHQFHDSHLNQPYGIHIISTDDAKLDIHQHIGT